MQAHPVHVATGVLNFADVLSVTVWVNGLLSMVTDPPPCLSHKRLVYVLYLIQCDTLIQCDVHV